MAKNQGDPAARLAGSIESKIEFVELETDKPIELLSVIFDQSEAWISLDQSEESINRIP